jgi:hypothetical protein
MNRDRVFVLRQALGRAAPRVLYDRGDEGPGLATTSRRI